MKRFLLSLVLVLASAAAALGFDSRPSPVLPDGTRVVVDLPADRHMRNTGGSDGAGLCVMTSLTMAADWQNIPEMAQFRKWSESRPGGSYPSLLVQQLNGYAKAKGIALPPYVQSTGGDEELLRLILKTRRMPCITYDGFDGFYNGRIAHMVDCAHLDGKTGAIVDNNRPGLWVSMTHDELIDRWNDRVPDPFFPVRPSPFRPRNPREPLLIEAPNDFGVSSSSSGWVFVWLAPPPPPYAKPLPPEKPQPAVSAVVWSAASFYGDPRRHWYAHRDGKFLGVYSPDGWHPAVSETAWLTNPQPMPADVSPPKDAPPAPCPGPNCPLNPSPSPCPGPNCPLKPQTPKFTYWVNGAEATRDQAVAAVTAVLTDDSARYHLSIVAGPTTNRELVASWFATGGPLAKYSPRLHVQVYDGASWVVRDRLNSHLTLQESAFAGGKTIKTWDKFTEPTVEGVREILASVFDAPEPAPMPQPVPVPTPAPAPHDPVDPPAPVTPAPAAPPSWITVLAMIWTALATFLGVAFKD